VIFSIGADYVIKKYDLYGLRQNSDQSISSDYEEIKDLFGDLKRLQSRDDYNTKKIELIEKKIECEILIKPLIEFDPDNIQEVKRKVKKSIPEENLKEMGFDKSKVVWRSRPAYQRANEKFGIEVTIGELPNQQLVAKKIYSLYNFEDVENVENEIKILTVLSNRATPENSYIKFYGVEMETVNETETRVILYMEAYSSSLIDKISEAKRKGELIEKDIVENAVRKLVQAFANMQTLGIYHRDIKPHNILVTDSWNLKIIDFSVSDALKHEGCYTTMTGNTTIQGTHGYMAPEVEEYFSKQAKSGKFRPGRADVFSLGLTLYQMLSLRDTHTLNFKSFDQYDRIKRLLNQLNCEEWVKILLTEMLNPDYHFRASFKQCLRFLPGSNATVDRTILL
jgi:serine/threonine protein kinase